MEAKKSFVEGSSSKIKDNPKPEMDPSMLATFLETCMKSLHDSKVIKRLQELINRCARTAPGEPFIVKKLGY